MNIFRLKSLSAFMFIFSLHMIKQKVFSHWEVAKHKKKAFVDVQSFGSYMTDGVATNVKKYSLGFYKLIWTIELKLSKVIYKRKLFFLNVFNYKYPIGTQVPTTYLDAYTNINVLQGKLINVFRTSINGIFSLLL